MPGYGVIGYNPSIEEVMEDMGVFTIEDIKPTLLGKIEQLRESAAAKGKIRVFDQSLYSFILCGSKEFYRTLVDLGYGNMAMTIVDEFNNQPFFLLFEDKVPKRFYDMPVVHESVEYDETKRGTDQVDAHGIASRVEIETAERLGMKEDYIKFLEDSYPQKLKELRENGIV